MKQLAFIILFILSFNLAFSINNSPPPTATISGGTTVCQNVSSPLVTFTGDGGTAPYTFTYTINGVTQPTITTTSGNSVSVSAPTGTAGSFNYSLISVHDISVPLTEITFSGTQTVTINPQANANISSSATADIFNGFPIFKVCSNQTTLIDFFNNSSTFGTNANYTINWGDSSPNFTSTNWTTLSHNYSVGLWTLTYSITAQNGCNVTKIYKVFVGNNPAVGLGNPGNTDICITSSLTFPITGTDNNPPGTTYIVTFNDSTPPTSITFNHPPPASVTHTFLTSSCGTSSSSGSTTYQNSFYASVAAINPCDQSSASVVPIRISTPPLANFTLPQNIKCTNSQICLTNTSTGGDSASSSSCSTPKIIWSINPNTGFSLASGTLGNDFGSTNTNSWASGSDSICPVFTVAGNYSITMKIGNRCGVDQKIKTICIEAPLIPLFTLNNNSGCTPLAVTTTNATSIANACIPATYQWNITYTSGFCGSAPAVWSYTSGTATSASPSFNFVTPGTYSISVTMTNSCGAVTSPVQTVIVKKPPTASINSIANFCGIANINPTAVVTPCAPVSSALTYAWSFPGGTPSTSTLATPGLINYPSSATPYTISLIVTNECGASNTATQQFSVNTAPVITNANLNQTICSGSSTTLVTLTANPAGTTFAWNAVATSGISGFIASGTTNTIPIQTITTTNASPGTVTYTIIPTIGACAGASVTYIITVNPAPIITAQPYSSTVCQGGTLTALSFTLSGATGTPQYQWYSNTSNSTVGSTLLAGATNTTYIPPSTTVGTLYYYCIITLPTGGCSSITSNIATATISPLPTVTTQPTPSQNLCVGVTIPSPLSATYSGGIGTSSYQWYSNTSNATTGGTLISGATSSTYTPPVYSLAGVYYYYVVINLSGNGCGIATSNNAQVTVFDDPTIVTQPTITQTLCQGATPTTLLVVATGGSGVFSYQWYSNSSNNTSSGVAIATATNASFIPPTTVVGTLYYYCLLSQTATLGCGVTSATAIVIINAAPTIVNQPGSSTVCLGGTPTVLSVTYTNGVGTPSYQWHSSLTNINSGGTLIMGATNSSYIPANAPVGTLFYYCVISLPSSGGCSSITSNTADVTINTGATIDVQPLQTQSICVGGTIQNPLTVSFINGTGTPTYQWYSNSTNATTGGTLVGTNLPTYTPPVFNTAGTYYHYVVIGFSGNGCGNITSAAAEIVVVSDPIVSTQPIPTQTLCQNETPTNLTVTISGGIGTNSYQWFSTVTSTNTGGTAIGTNSSSFTPPTNSVGTFYYYCAITQSGVACSVNSNSVTVIINTSPTIANQPSSSTVCQNGTPTTLFFTFSNGVGIPTYQWYSNTSNSSIGGTSIPTETNPTFIPTTTSIGIAYYYCIITFPDLIGSCSSVATNVAIVTINPQSTVDVQPLPTQSICVGGTIQNPLTVSFINSTGTPTYQWYSNTTNATTGGTPVGTNLPTYTPPIFNTTGTYYHYVVIGFSGNGCGNITSAAAEIVVVSDPTVSTQPILTQTLCQTATAAALTVIASGGIGTYSYQWYSTTSNSTSGGTLISGETTDTFTPSTINAGTLYYYCEITQPTGIGCNVSSQTSEVNVNIAPTISGNPTSSTICLGQTPTQLIVSFINGTGTPSYQWYSNTSNSNVGGTAITTEISATFNPPSATAGTYYYYCTITFPSLSGGCEIITSNVASVIIEQIPIISNQNPTICSGATFTTTPINSLTDIVPIGTTYTWSLPTISPVGAINGASAQAVGQNSISQTLINTITAPATATYTITPTIGICTGATFTITIIVNPATIPNTIKTDITCFGINNGNITTNITGGIPFISGEPYLISWTGPNSFASSLPNISGLFPGVYNLSITDAGGCPISNNYTINEPSDIVITTDTNNNITCFGNNNGEITISVTGGTVPYNYAWTKNGQPFGTTEDISNLAPETYVVTVSDAYNCGPKTATFTITEPPILSINLASQTNVDCYGFATGAITVNISGGTPIQTTPGVFDYNFAWTGLNGFTSSNQNITNLLAGTYNLTVTDNLGCTENSVFTITESPEIIISATTTPIVCYGDNNATITVTLSGGNAPYQVQWSNLAVGLYQNNLAPGDYIITVTDNIGCVKTATINIPSPPIFAVNPVITNISCFGAQDGSIVLNFVGGIAPVNLVWSDGSPAGITRNNLGPGVYSVIITDSKPCTISRTFSILEPQPLVLSANTTNALDCNDANTGAINLLVSGGTPPFNYLWNNGATTEDLNNILAGNYLVTVTDFRGCSKTAQYNITRPNPLTLSVNTTTNANCNTHTVTQIFTAQPTGGVPPYQLNWSSGTVTGVDNEFMTTTQNGLIILTATDAIGCITNYSLNIAMPTLGNASFSTTSVGYISYGIYSILDPIQFNSTITGDYTSVLWDFGDGTFSNEINPIHTYLIPNDYYLVTQTVTYPFGCVYVMSLALNVEKGYLLVVPTAFTPNNNDGINDTLRPVTKGLKNVRLYVYDTWGSLIYGEVGDVLVGWNGKIKDISSENGNYYAKVSGETFYGTIVNENHTFVLIK